MSLPIPPPPPRPPSFTYSFDVYGDSLEELKQEADRKISALVDGITKIVSFEVRAAWTSAKKYVADVEIEAKL